MCRVIEREIQNHRFQAHSIPMVQGHLCRGYMKVEAYVGVHGLIDFYGRSIIDPYNSTIIP